MNTVCLLGHCGRHLPPPPFEGCVFNHPFVVSSLIWAVVVLILGVLIACLVYYYMKNKDKLKLTMTAAVQKHELDMRKVALEQEKFWYFQKNLKCDFKRNLEDEIENLKNEKKELSEKLENEKKERARTLKEERLQAEHDFYEKILNQFYSPLEDKSQKE